VAGLPTVFAVTQLLDTGEFEQALAAIGPERRELGAEYALLRVRALLGTGREQEAIDSLMRLLAAPLVAPELRAGGARLLVECGWHDAGFQQTSRAFAESPAAPAVRVTHAWAALRLARRRNPVALAHTASIALSGLQTRDAPQPALLLALRACAEAHVGDAGRAVRLAQRALRLEPLTADAQVAVAFASARLRRVHDARQAWRRLLALAPVEAEALRAPLARLGVQLADTPPPTGDERAHTVIESIWDPQEVSVLNGQAHQAIRAFECECREQLARLAEVEREPSFPDIARVAATMLTEAPVWQHFAPYDFSLYSGARVEAALRVLYAADSTDRETPDEFPVLALVASYLGETLCHAHDADWQGSLLELDQVEVVAEHQRWAPFRLVQGCIHNGSPLELDAPQHARASHPGSEAWSRSVPNPVSPPCPWWPDPWPPVARMKRLGRELSRSIVSRYCEQYAGSPLDGSIASLDALDSYVSLVAPPTLRSDPEAPWSIRIAVLAGAYLGEVLREALGGEWLDPRTAELEANRYRFRLARGVIVTPVLVVLERVTGTRTTPIRTYASQLAC
jgi:tetratricopeptide (TPR) repeat protein